MSVPNAQMVVGKIWRLTFVIYDTVLNRSLTERYNFEVNAQGPGGTGTVATLAQATTAATKIAGYRRALFSAQASLHYARMSVVTSTSAAFPLFTTAKLGIPLTGESPQGAGEDSGTTLQFRLGTLSGKHNVRQFGFNRDTAITASAIASMTLSDYDSSAPPAITGDGTGQATAEVAYKAWMSVLQQMTFRARRVSGGWQVEPWASIQYQRPSSKKLRLHYVL